MSSTSVYIINRGFTLIELSLVLVIIGLLIGGVLMGKDMIDASLAKKQISKLDALDSGVAAFKMKYDGLPGDLHLTKAAMFGLPYESSALTAPRNFHNGNGILDEFDTVNYLSCRNRTNIGPICVMGHINYYGEGHYFMLQLTAARLSPYNITSTTHGDIPNSAAKLDYGDGYISPGTSTWMKGGYLLGMGTSSLVSSHLATNAANGSFTPAQALRFDTKFDDGKPTTGIVRAAHYEPLGYPFNVDYGPSGAYTRTCVSGAIGSSVYDTTTSPDTKQCILWVQGQW